MLRWPLLVLACLLTTLGLAACGGGDEDVGAVLKQTFGENHDIKSGRLDLNLRVDAQGGQSQGPVSVSLRGPFQSTKPTVLPRFDFDAQVTAGGQTIDAGATSTGDAGFVSLRGADYALPAEVFNQFKDGYAQQAKKNDDKDAGVSFKSLGIDPRRWLTDAEKAGNEKIGGADTIHIRSGVDVPALLQDVNKVLANAQKVGAGQSRELTEEQRKQVAEAVKDARVDIWTGEDDKIMRRINVTLRFEVPKGQESRTQGIQKGTLRFDMTFADLNKDQKIAAPKNTRPLSELASAIQGGATTPSAPSDSGGSASGGSPSGSAYQQCQQEANGDIRKLQECAALIGK